MSFATSLRTEAESIFQAIYQHPFVQGIANGHLPPASLIHYVQQDKEYLKTYGQVYGLALSKAADVQQMRIFYERIGLLLNLELLPHQNLCKVAGIAYEDVPPPAGLSPTAHHYATHMLNVAKSGTLADIVSVVLPCHWVYVELAKNIVRDIHLDQAHPFYDWISFYANPEMETVLAQLIDLLNFLADTASPQEKTNMKTAFLTSYQLEYRFFDMAYRQEQWIQALI